MFDWRGWSIRRSGEILFERSEIDRAGIARRVLSAALALASVRVAGLSFWRPRRPNSGRPAGAAAEPFGGIEFSQQGRIYGPTVIGIGRQQSPANRQRVLAPVDAWPANWSPQSPRRCGKNAVNFREYVRIRSRSAARECAGLHQRGPNRKTRAFSLAALRINGPRRRSPGDAPIRSK